MAVARCNWPTSFEHANSMLGTRTKVKIGHNTVLWQSFNGEILAKYHGNAIVSYMPGDYAISSAGWNTVTTSGRLHDALLALHKGNQVERHNVNVHNGKMFLDQETPITEKWLKVN